MAKVLLVEDDNNLREIYEARLQAEGYTIVSANDGEAALVIAKNEKPDLIISDVMMPKISGFEMLDILRNTDGLKDVKVIMLTALGQADDQARAGKLGADRYLVKSQVTLEDIVKVSHELLEGPETPPAATPGIAASVPAAEPAAAPEPAAPADDTPAPVAEQPAPAITVTPPPAEPDTTLPEPATTASEPPAAAPADPGPATAPAATMPADPAAAQTTATEEASVEQQIEDFVNNQSPAAPPAEPETAPAETTPASETAAATANDASLTEAVNNLVADAADNAADTAAPAQEPASEADASQPEADAPGHRKIIQPLESAPQKSLDQLLAEEEAGAAAAPPAGEQPSGAPTPAPSTQAETTGPDKPFDPNSIAL